VELTPVGFHAEPVSPPAASSPAGPRSLEGALAGVPEGTLQLEQAPCRRAEYSLRLNFGSGVEDFDVQSRLGLGAV